MGDNNGLNNLKLIRFLSNDNRRPTFVILILALTYYLLYGAINPFVETKVVPVFANFESNRINTYISVLLLLLSVLYLAYKIYNRMRRPNFDNITILSFIIILYCIHRFSIPNSQTWHYTSLPNTPHIYYSDLFIISFLILSLELSKTWKSTKYESQKHFIEDNFASFGEKDLLSRTRLANEIAEFINGTETINSFAIGIIGNWGSGKSVFLKQLLNSLDDSYIKIEFNPWRHSKPNLLLDDFFQTFSSALKGYDSSLSRHIHVYYQALVSTDVSVLTKLSRQVLGLVYPEKTIKDKYVDIIKCITKNKFRITVFIDDLDRLDNKEIIETLRIIRNTANFPNTFFITAYEQQYILKAIENKHIPDVNRFLEKIFQVEIHLPSYPDSIINETLMKLLSENRTQKEYELIKGSIRQISTIPIKSQEDTTEENSNYFLLKESITNLRDVVRFVNSFNIDFNLHKDEIDMTDFILLVIIKLKDPGAYSLLLEELTQKGSLEYFTLVGGFSKESKVLEFKPELFLKHYEEVSIGTKNGPKNCTIKAIEYLFNQQREIINQRTIRYPENCLLYFSTELFNKISFREFNSARNKGFHTIKTFISKCIEEEKTNELSQIFRSTQVFSDRNDFESFIQGMIYLCKNSEIDLRDSILQKLENLQQVIKFYYNNKIADFKSFIHRLWEEAEYPFFIEAEINFSFLYKHLTNSTFEKEIYEKEELLRSQLSFLKRYSSDMRTIGVTTEAFGLYYRNQQSIDPESRIITLSNRANHIFRRLIEKFPDSYLSILIRPLYQPHDDRTYALEGFISQTFGSFNDFELFLSKQANSLQNLEVKSFYYKFKMNNYQPIDFTRNQVLFYSNEECIFYGSNKHKHIPYPNSCISFKHPYTKAILKNPTNNDFRYSKWIAHSDTISEDEANNGGDYKIRFQFRIDLDNRSITSTIRLFVDDICQLKLNNRIIKSNIVTEVFNSIQPENIKPFESKIRLKNGVNTLDFLITNRSKAEFDNLIPDRLLTPNENPYGIIFVIQIDF